MARKRDLFNKKQPPLIKLRPTYEDKPDLEPLMSRHEPRQEDGDFTVVRRAAPRKTEEQGYSPPIRPFRAPLNDPDEPLEELVPLSPFRREPEKPEFFGKDAIVGDPDTPSTKRPKARAIEPVAPWESEQDVSVGNRESTLPQTKRPKARSHEPAAPWESERDARVGDRETAPPTPRRSKAKANEPSAPWESEAATNTKLRRAAKAIADWQEPRLTLPAQEQRKRSFRHELKYYLNPLDYEAVRASIASLLPPDEHSRNGGYHIRSLYFDDFENSAMYEKVNGVQKRKKYRIRIYNLNDREIKLERKFKDGQYISKDSLWLTREEYESIIAGEYNFLLYKDNQLAHDFYMELKLRLSRPVVIVDYYREAFVYPLGDVRITFDTDLRTSPTSLDIFDRDLPTMPMFENGMMVLEVKFNEYLPEFIRAVLNNGSSFLHSAVSKYVICRKYE